MSLVKGDPKIDFFEQNPELRYKTAFKDIIDNHTKKTASKICWAVYLTEDPDSKFYNVPYKDRLAEIRKTYYRLDVNKYKDFIREYAKAALSKEELMFKIHIDTFDELTSYLQDLNLRDEKGFNRTMKIMEKLAKMWEGFEKIKTRLIETKKKTQIRGDGTQGSREKRF